jgi:hypothetical protein
MDALSFLQSVSGFVQSERTSAADRPPRLATVDPAYNPTTFPGTLPRVTFDGEAVMSQKRYAVLGPTYVPSPSERVLLLAVGGTYVIVGPINATPRRPVMVSDSTDITGISSGGAAAGSPVVGTSFVAPPSGQVWINVSGWMWSSLNTVQVILGFELRAGATVGSGTVVTAVNAERALITPRAVTSGGPADLNATRRVLQTGLTPGSSYNVRTMHWVNPGGSVAGTVSFRSLSVEPIS